MNSSYFSSTIQDFLITDDNSIFGSIAKNDKFSSIEQQKNSWIYQIKNLKNQLACFQDGKVFFEFSVPRMGKRVDVILHIRNIIFTLEYKVGSPNYDKSSADQVLDYALDLKCFHEGSHNRYIVPILIATNAPEKQNILKMQKDRVADVILSNGQNLAAIIFDALNEINQIITCTPEDNPSQESNSDYWEDSGYKPTPTIIEAAQALYSGHAVEDISRSDAGAKNLTVTNQCISQIIDGSRKFKRKSICFVTGVPGAGKTLAGLNVSTQQFDSESGEHATFLSGNGPLVTVLREALTRDEIIRAKIQNRKITKGDAERKVKAFVQNIHHFRDAGLTDNKAPAQHVVVFDEAQRAWDRETTVKFIRRKTSNLDFNMSEPEFLISLMDRRDDWCTIICLVGGGQEINNGEAGLVEWFEALKNHFRHWDVYHSGQLKNENYNWGVSLDEKLSGLNVTVKDDLHLSVSIRSFRAEKLSDFIGAILNGDNLAAQNLVEDLQQYPVFLTRDLQQARDWLRSTSRGTQRIGLVASSGAIRLKPEGVVVKATIDPAVWFLNDKQDVRSSYYLEDVATEFDIQGLELDWVGVCWDADFRRENGIWKGYNFSGSKWRNIHNAYNKVYIKNAYRVLLTRARQGMIIFVPKGDAHDQTRLTSFYNETYDFLKSCGLKEI